MRPLWGISILAILIFSLVVDVIHISSGYTKMLVIGNLGITLTILALCIVVAALLWHLKLPSKKEFLWLKKKAEKFRPWMMDKPLRAVPLTSIFVFIILSLAFVCVTVILNLMMGISPFKSLSCLKEVLSTQCVSLKIDSGESITSPSDEPLVILGLIVASLTFAMSIWRGFQTDEQITKAQDQIDQAALQVKTTYEQAQLANRQLGASMGQLESARTQALQARLQNAIEMATDKENSGRCVSGLRQLDYLYKGLRETDRQVVHSVALSVLSISRATLNEWNDKFLNMVKEEKTSFVGQEMEQIARKDKTSRTARQWSLDFLLLKKFLSFENHLKIEGKKSDKKKSRMEISVLTSMKDKDLSNLELAGPEGKSDLSAFSLQGCNFYGANLEGVLLYGVNLTDVNLTNVKNLLSDDELEDIDESGNVPEIEKLGWAFYVEKPTERYARGRSGDIAAIMNQDHVVTSRRVVGSGHPVGYPLGILKYHVFEWEGWKKFVLKQKEKEDAQAGTGKPDDMKQEVWEYLVALAKGEIERPE